MTTRRNESATPAEPAWLQIAREYDGLRENSVRGQELIPEFFRMAGVSGDHADAWCGAYASWCMRQAGIEPPKVGARARNWLAWGETLLGPRYGCVVVFRRPDPQPKTGSKRTYHRGLGHVAFLIEQHDIYTEAYGGNQMSRVCRADYPTDDILGYRWPEGVP